MTDLLKKLDEVYQYAVENEHSDFYRNLYGHNRPERITTWEDWKRLPLLTKGHIAAVPFLKRLFTPFSEIGTVRLTSGTSGGRPLAYPRSVSSVYADHFDDTHPTRVVLNFFTPQHLMQNSCREAESKHIVIEGDPSDLKGSLKFAQSAGLDHILCTPSTIEALIPLFDSSETRDKIKRIELAGETLTNAGAERLRTAFQNAYLWSDYAMVESQGVAGVGPIHKELGTIYLPTAATHWELVGEDSELVISHTWIEHNHFPLLRYRTGDRAETVAYAGKDHYRILGRIDLDRIKLHGGELRADVVERAVFGLHPALDGDYLLRLTYVHKESRMVPEVEIRLTTRGDASVLSEFADHLAELLATKIRVAPNYTYADGVRDGHYAPLKCAVVPAILGQSTKTKRFHIDDRSS